MNRTKSGATSTVVSLNVRRELRSAKICSRLLLGHNNRPRVRSGRVPAVVSDSEMYIQILNIVDAI